ncbi:hypothetical protein EYF80_010750 [Liparis tanakae]|uniref:Uncharacterized protein n=1 Tax=Liparis tanakae TaxID=230148 RepID=A0A4Z2IMQ5_9TELE|nr:hypothetical protein EYF80_010750 [Liparis tanakae]
MVKLLLLLLLGVWTLDVLTRILTRPSSDPLAPKGGGERRAPVQHTDRTLQHTRLRDTLRSARSCHEGEEEGAEEGEKQGAEEEKNAYGLKMKFLRWIKVKYLNSHYPIRAFCCFPATTIKVGLKNSSMADEVIPSFKHAGYRRKAEVLRVVDGWLNGPTRAQARGSKVPTDTQNDNKET